MTVKPFKYLPKLLLLILSSYIGLVIMLTHVHIIDGNIIVHAHLQRKEANTKNTSDGSQSHSQAELIILNQLSAIDLQPKLLGQLKIEKATPKSWQTLLIAPYWEPIEAAELRHYSLRAPPPLA